jgi:outer membrane lipoprotein-sorting protein
MNPVIKIVAVGILLLLAGTAGADGPSSQPEDAPGLPTTRASMDVIAHIQKQLHGITSVESDFVEHKNLAMLNHTLTISGHIGLAKPDRLIWIVREPVKYAIRIEGDEVRQWDEDTNHVDVIHLGGDPTFRAVSEQIQAWFLGDYKVLGDSYDVYLTQAQPVALAFIPNVQSMVSKLIKRIDVTFNPDETYIDTMVLRETGGDVTTIHFINTRVNQPIPEGAWEMPPNER